MNIPRTSLGEARTRAQLRVPLLCYGGQARDIDLQSLAQIEGGLVKRFFAGQRPKVEMVARSLALEATESLLEEVDGKDAIGGGATGGSTIGGGTIGGDVIGGVRFGVKGACAATLGRRTFGCLKVEQIEDLGHLDIVAKPAIIDGGHGWCREQRRGTRNFDSDPGRGTSTF